MLRLLSGDMVNMSSSYVLCSKVECECGGQELVAGHIANYIVQPIYRAHTGTGMITVLVLHKLWESDNVRCPSRNLITGDKHGSN
jgi:hypothetical protein